MPQPGAAGSVAATSDPGVSPWALGRRRCVCAAQRPGGGAHGSAPVFPAVEGAGQWGAAQCLLGLPADVPLELKEKEVRRGRGGEGRKGEDTKGGGKGEREERVIRSIHRSVIHGRTKGEPLSNALGPRGLPVQKKRGLRQRLRVDLCTVEVPRIRARL